MKLRAAYKNSEGRVCPRLFRLLNLHTDFISLLEMVQETSETKPAEIIKIYIREHSHAVVIFVGHYRFWGGDSSTLFVYS